MQLILKTDKLICQPKANLDVGISNGENKSSLRARS